MTRVKAALFYDYPAGDGAVFDESRRARIAALAELYPHVVHGRNFAAHAPNLAEVEAIFATWGMPNLSEAELDRLPKLKAVFYAAGNVRAFAERLVGRGIVLTSAWGFNAISVAEMCLAQILLSLRGYFRAVRQYREVRSMQAKAFPRPGVNGETVGLIGLGQIGARLAGLLAAYPLKVIAHDPFLTPQRAAELGVESVALEELFRRAYVVRNHLPDLPETRGAIGAGLLGAMRAGATFVNTGRGAQVAEAELAAVLAVRPDLTALLDVTWPEPPAADSPLRALPNVVISPHVGGAVGDEASRLADCAIEEFEAWAAGRPLRWQVTAAVLRTMG